MIDHDLHSCFFGFLFILITKTLSYSKIVKMNHASQVIYENTNFVNIKRIKKSKNSYLLLCRLTQSI